MRIPINKPYVSGKEYDYIKEAVYLKRLCGNGEFTKRCHRWLQQLTSCAKALLTHSCTAALEMSAILLDIKPGDEVIMPSFTFVSTANAFVLRGATPVFVDVTADTLCIDPQLIEAAITPRTKAIVPVHYAGVSCDMTAIMDIAKRHNLYVVEDAAHSITATYKGQQSGTHGHLATFSFHETKNLICGEGGALIVNDPQFAERAEFIWEKGTNRAKFFRGQVDKYTWVDVGSSYLPSELNAAYLWAQLEIAEEIMQKRKSVWRHYYQIFAESEAQGLVRRPIIPAESGHNAHMFYLIMQDSKTRDQLVAELAAKSIGAPFHYVPLHSSPAGKKFSRTHGSLAVTNDLSSRLIRLPLWAGIADSEVNDVVDGVMNFLAHTYSDSAAEASMV